MDFRDRLIFFANRISTPIAHGLRGGIARALTPDRPVVRRAVSRPHAGGLMDLSPGTRVRRKRGGASPVGGALRILSASFGGMPGASLE
jgi:hypothetical protein